MAVAKAKLRRQEMNRTEEKYAWVLENHKLAGFIVLYEFQALTLRLGDDCRYTPDFFVVTKDMEIECHEVKGFMRDDALVKIKAAAAKFPFVFKLAKLTKEGWDVKEIKP